MSQIHLNARPGFLQRLLLATPVLGSLSRAIAKDITTVYYLLVILVTAVVLAMKAWGLVALALTALAMVPIMFGVLFLISRG